MEFVNHKRRVYHQSMALILKSLETASKFGQRQRCSDGITRVWYPAVTILSADYEEQLVKFVHPSAVMTSSDMCTMYGAGAVRTRTWLCCVRERSGPAPWLCCVRERSGPAFFTFASASWPQACTSHLGAATGGCALSHLAHPVYLCSHISLSLLFDLH